MVFAVKERGDRDDVTIRKLPPMHLTHYREFAQDLPTDSASVSRNDFERGYEDEETFERPHQRSRHQRRQDRARLLAHCRANVLDDDEILDETVLDFSDR